MSETLSNARKLGFDIRNYRRVYRPAAAIMFGATILAGCGGYTPSTTLTVRCGNNQSPHYRVAKGLMSPEQRNILVSNQAQTILIYSQQGKYSGSLNDLTAHTAGQIVAEVGTDAYVVAGTPERNVFTNPSNGFTLACKSVLGNTLVRSVHISTP